MNASRAPPDLHERRIVQLVEGAVAKGGQDALLDELGGQLASAAVAEEDLARPRGTERAVVRTA